MHSIFNEGFKGLLVLLAKTIKYRRCGNLIKKTPPGIRMALITTDQQVNAADIGNGTNQLFQNHLAEKAGGAGNQHLLSSEPFKDFR